MEQTPPAPDEDPMPPLWIGDLPNPEYEKWWLRNRPPDLGFGDDFGRAICHGCGNAFENKAGKHKRNCPRVCTWKICAFHQKTSIY
jgi:hypothetical protein